MSRFITTMQEVEDLVRGVTFFGTGGGGDPVKGSKFLKETLKDVGKIEIIDVNELDNDATVCTCFYMGSIAPHTPEVQEKMKKMGYADIEVERVLPEAVKRLEKYIGKKIDAIVAIELGGINTPAPIDAAARLGKKIINGDYAGRAIPEIVQTTPSLAGKSVCPMTSVDEWGNVVYIEKVKNHLCAEAMGKAISTVAFGLVGQTSFVMTGKEMKEIIIEGTITESLAVGKVLREAAESGKDPAKKVADLLNGWVLFKGKVVEKVWEDKEGYFWGTNTIKGTDDFSGHEFKIWFKNENHITWLDGEVYVTSPDIIEVIDSKTGEPITNPAIKTGDEVTVVGVKKRAAFDNKVAIDRVGPVHYGFDIKHKPIEEVVK